MSDPVNHPSHYTAHPSGVECITITEHMSFLRGNALKYLWRAGDKGNELEDLRKARWYLDREISNLEKVRVLEPVEPTVEFFTDSLTDEERAERAEREEPAPLVDAQPACECGAAYDWLHQRWCPVLGGPGRSTGG